MGPGLGRWRWSLGMFAIGEDVGMREWGASWVGLGLSTGLKEGREGVALLASWSFGGMGTKRERGSYMYVWMDTSIEAL
jgi:hypothetical protein